jgi:NADH:ubiquinone oxidoreductase subunit F (NADH-binding)
MKTIIIAIATAVVFIGGLESCQSCTICTKGSEPDVRLCKSDYSSDGQYHDAIVNKENDGFSCNN